MTERILRALGETDERYFLAYAENMNVKNPKKIILRRWLSAAAVLIVLVGVVLSLPPVRYALLTRPVYTQKNFSSYTEMMSALDIPQHDTAAEHYYSPSQTFSYGSRLSLIDFDSYDTADYYFCYEQSRYYSLAMVPPPKSRNDLTAFFWASKRILMVSPAASFLPATVRSFLT